MNVLINRESMTFLRAMDNHSALDKLADLEFPHVAVAICYTDEPNDFSLFSDHELKLLIKNSMGPDVKHVFARDTLLRTALGVARALPVFKCNTFELDLQWRTIAPGDKRRFKYVPGSVVPVLDTGLEEAALVCSAAAVKVPAAATNAVVQATPAPAAAQAATDDFVAPREGTSTHKIFSFCADLWKESGYTNDKTTLDNIRKKAVDQLVPTGLNISTVRTQAARWYQHRQRFVF